jgi:hypothetical protein
VKNVYPKIMFTVALGLFLAVVAFTFRKVDLSLVLAGVTLGSFALVLLMGLAKFYAYGLVLRVLFREQYQVQLAYSEALTLPLMMVLFVYVLPFKGGLIFQTFYMKHRHQLDLSKGYSLGLMFFFVNLVLTVLLGLGLNFYLKLESGAILYLLLLMASGLIALPLVLKLVPADQPGKKGVLYGFISFLNEVKSQLRDQLSNMRMLGRLILSDGILAVIQTIWYQSCATMLGFESAFFPTLLVVLVLRIALLLRLLPGNLGFQELIIAVVFTAAGFSLEEGLLLALVIRLVSVLLALTIGVGGLYANLRSMNLNSLRSLVRKVSAAE